MGWVGRAETLGVAFGVVAFALVAQDQIDRAGDGLEATAEFQIALTVGVEAEMELPFAAAQQLFAPFLELMERLPQPQHDALEVAFGIVAATGCVPPVTVSSPSRTGSPQAAQTVCG